MGSPLLASEGGRPRPRHYFVIDRLKAVRQGLADSPGALTTGPLSSKGIASHARKKADIFAEDRVKAQYVLAGSLA
ncbi:MAG: hypothetical protein AB7D51_15620, partial [Desulfovibrionaceae bacterium]